MMDSDLQGHRDSGQRCSPWVNCDAFLQPEITKPLRNIVVCDLPAQCYIIGTSSKKNIEQKEVLLFNKSDGGPLVYSYSRSYTADEVDSLTACASKEGRLLHVKALLGCVRFTSGYYLLLATRRQTVARIGFNRIFEALDIELVSLCLPKMIALTTVVATKAATVLGVKGPASSSIQKARLQEEEYCRQFLSSAHKQNLFYSRTYDLTNTLQSNMTIPSQRRLVRTKFVWNEFLLEPLFTLQETESVRCERESAQNGGQSYEAAPLCPKDLRRWFVYVAQGSVVQRAVWCGSRPLLFTLIARTSKNYAGARYFRRGVNGNGHVANHVEIEQIISDESTLHDYGRRGSFTSYVQVRGSVPLHWFQPPTQLPKPPIKLGMSNFYCVDTCRHFQELLGDYGAPVIVVNLLRKREKHLREGALGSEFKKAVETLIGYTKKDFLGGCESSSNVLIYREYDIRASAQDAWNKTTSLAEEVFAKNGFFVCGTDASTGVDTGCYGRCCIHSNGYDAERSVRLQQGVTRSNCLDCVDRTNLAQYFFGLHALGYQLHALGLLHSPIDLSLSPQVREQFLHMYLLMGDIIALHYGGSAQVGAGVLNRGTGWDKMMGIKRLYNNILGDREKQLFMNLFLGRFQPCPNRCSPSQNPVMRIPDGEQQGTGSDGKGNESNESTNSSKQVACLADLSEGASDYYLVVNGGPSLPDPTELVGWWKKPLQFFSSFFQPRQRSLLDENAPSSPVSFGFVPHEGGNGKGSADDEEEYIVREICIDERAAAIDPYTNRGLVGAGAGELKEEGSAVLLQRTTAATTSLNRKTRTLLTAAHTEPSPQILWFVQDSLCNEQHQEAEFPQSDVASNKRDIPTEKIPDDLLYHDHLTYPDYVLGSEFNKNIETARCMCDNCVPEDDLQRMQLEVMHKYGDPCDWGVETVIDALLDVEPGVKRETIDALRQMNVHGRTLLNMNTKSLEEKVLLQRFIRLVDKLFRSASSSPPQHVRDDEMSELWLLHQHSDALEKSNIFASCKFVSCPDATQRVLQPFFRDLLAPDIIAATLRTLISKMADPDSGVPRSDRIRYREGSGCQYVPPVVVAQQCFSSNELHEWLLTESPRLGLTLHEHVESHERAQACWQFVLWLVHAKIVVPISIELVSGVLVPPVVTRADVTSSTRLFTLSTIQELHVLNESERHPCGDVDVLRVKINPIKSTPLLLTGASALACAETLVAVALDTLLYMQDMSSPTVPPDVSHNPTAWKLLETVSTSSAHLASVNIRGLERRELFCFWANVFNALYIHAWMSTLGKRAQDFTCFYNTNGYNVGGCFFSLSDIKDGILRGNKPAYYAVLPPFSKSDPRLFMVIPPDPSDIEVELQMKSRNCFDDKHITTSSRRDLHTRILLALIDAYLVPENFEDMPSYNPRTLLFASSPTVASRSAEGSNSSFLEDDLEIDESYRSRTTVGLWHANSIPVVAATWLSSWFNQRHTNKSSTLANPCVPLTPEHLLQQIHAAESFVLRSLSRAPQPTVPLHGVHVPRALLPLFVNMDNASIDEFMQLLSVSPRSETSLRCDMWISNPPA
ncbi:Polyphosphoinositide phosphatase, putative [Trypanosoma equiperdum]|uniref:Polyphosphoinositide phosphatase, putative n=1 Tax=Trypanosoma equiperdum TaxID=5694 RepID=A0A1G4I3R7_TRYEQ|nr:Polyphosphoinositide phosphatase, putative [Trypanosoma equiperdum]